jgi:hypothetical protein
MAATHRAKNGNGSHAFAPAVQDRPTRQVRSSAMTGRLRLSDDPARGGPLPWWAVRLDELTERELRLLSYVTGGHVPFEVHVNLEQLDAERAELLVHAGRE